MIVIEKNSYVFERLFVYPAHDIVPSPLRLNQACSVKFFDMVRQRRWRDIEVFGKIANTGISIIFKVAHRTRSAASP